MVHFFYLAAVLLAAAAAGLWYTQAFGRGGKGISLYVVNGQDVSAKLIYAPRILVSRISSVVDPV